MISIHNFSYRFKGNEKKSLSNINLEINTGEFIVLTGPSGCGKSTLALAIGGYLFSQFEGDYSGQILIDGLDIQKANIYDIADKIGLVQQNPEAQFCTLTVIDEIAFGLENRRMPPAYIKERLDWALAVVNASDLIDREIASLSGGEKQKIAIAAMMANKPEVLIFDEPTSNLDPTATREIFEVISDLRKQTQITVIVIEHKTAYLSAFQPRMIHMEMGRIQQESTFKHIFSNPVSAKHGEFSINQGADPIIMIKDLQSGYNGTKILDGVNLSIYPGEFVAIMGDNGSGKSTFIRNIMGLMQPTHGAIHIFGKPVKDTPIYKRAQQIGLVFQNPEHQLFTNSVWDEAIFAPRNFGILDKAVLESADILLLESGLQDYKNRHPYRLSYGEKRRLNLISILTYAPCLLLLDEILIGQDMRNATFLLDLIKAQITKGGSALMVNHNPDISYRYANRLIFFEKGRVEIDAPIQEGFEILALSGKASYLPSDFFIQEKVPQ